MIPEYVTNIPEIGEKIEVAIQELIDNTSRTTRKLKNLKRTSPEDDTPKKEKRQQKTLQKNTKSPSTKEGYPKRKSLKLIKTKKTEPES